MWQLTNQEPNKRIYTNDTTGSKCETKQVYQDKEGNYWWSFTDLITIPYTRQFAATKISSLYSLGLSKDDLNNHINGLKNILKSNDKEKYEKAYSIVLDFESKANNATDAVKQMSSLVCVYFLLNDEPIDSFDGALQAKKMGILESDLDAHCFFLSLQVSVMENYTNHLSLISKIVSSPVNES